MRFIRSLLAPALALALALPVTLTAAQAQTNKVRIGKVIGGNGFHIPTYIAWDQGYYKDEGLDASFVVLQGAALVRAALAGNVDFVPIPSGGAQAALSGAAITYVVGQSLRSQWTIVVPKSINKIEELKGKTIGYGRAGGADYDEGAAVLQRHFKMEVGKDYKVISFQSEQDRIAALINGNIQAALLSVPHAARASTAGSIDGSTRSGGLWPSMKVLMLMITFSPMSMRPSMVAEPMCGSSTTLPSRASRTSLGLTAGSCSNTSRPAPASSPASIMRASAFSSITSPRAVLTTIGVGLQQLQPARREQVIGRRRVRAVDRDDVHARQHLVEAFPIGRLELLLDRGRDARGGCDSGSAGRTRARAAPPPGRSGPCRRCRAACPRCGGRASRSATSRSSCLVAGQHGGALGEPPRHGQDQRHRHVGGVFGQHARRVGHGDAALDRGGDVDVVDAVAEVGDQLEVARRPGRGRRRRSGR
jgi:hypothetical protein